MLTLARFGAGDGCGGVGATVWFELTKAMLVGMLCFCCCCSDVFWYLFFHSWFGFVFVVCVCVFRWLRSCLFGILVLLPPNRNGVLC